MDFATSPSFFRQGPKPLTRVIACAGLAFALMIGDARFGMLEGVRESASVLLYPVQWMVNAPVEGLSRLSAYLSSHAQLEQDNHALRSERLELDARLQRLANLEQENAELRRLAGLRAKRHGASYPAEILYLSRDPFSYKIIIDQGEQSHVKAGYPVIDSDGLIGQVTRVQPLTSEVTLIVEKNHVVPVMVQRNGLRAVMFGTGGGIEVRYLPNHADIAENDILMTSGIDGVYPAGLAVARVVKVDRSGGSAFARIVCAPIGQVDKRRLALVLAEELDLPPRPAPAPEIKPKRKGRRAASESE